MEHRDGADVMKRIAAPMVGGMFTSAFLEPCHIRILERKGFEGMSGFLALTAFRRFLHL